MYYIMRTCDYTNYPDIFKNTYWGQGDLGGIPPPHIVENRNIFVTEFGILNTKRSPEYIHKHYVLTGTTRHCETYYTKDKDYVLVSSPYNPDVTPFIENGWTKYSNLYSDSATTWIKIVPFRNKILLGNDVTLK
jgi:hypothetical protein